MNDANCIYRCLNSKQRTTAYMLAAVRGDHAEMKSIDGAAPMILKAQSHHSRRMNAAWSLAASVRLEQNQLAADLWHAQTRRAWLPTSDLDDEDLDAANLWDAMVAICRYRLSLLREAWSITCDRLGFPESFLNQFGECVALQSVERMLDSETPTEAELQEKLAAVGHANVGTTLGMTTAVEKADELLAMFGNFGGHL